VEELVKTLLVPPPAPKFLMSSSTYGLENKIGSLRDADTLTAVAMEMKSVTTLKWSGPGLLKSDVVSLLVPTQIGTTYAANTPYLVTLLASMFTPIVLKRQRGL